MKLNPKALGLTLGIFMGAAALLLMAVSLLTGYQREVITIIGSLHPYFYYTYLGTLWMGVLHFACGFVVGWLFGKLYNKLVG